MLFLVIVNAECTKTKEQRITNPWLILYNSFAVYRRRGVTVKFNIVAGSVLRPK